MGKRSNKGRLGWSAAVGVLISALLIWWTLRDVSLADVWAHTQGVNWMLFLAAIGAATLTFPLRTVRWQYLLRLEGEPIPFLPLWHATAIGFMSTNVTFGRAGEFVRAYAAKRLAGTKFTTAVGSIAVERVFDGITLVAFLVIASWAGGFGSQTAVGNLTLGAIGKFFAAVFSLALLVAVVFVRWPEPALRTMRSVSGSILPDTWANRLVETIQGLVEGLDVLRSPRRFFAVLFWSLIVWTTGAASFWLGFLAFGIEVPWSAALLLQSLLAFGVAVQFSPGFFGQFEAICRATLVLYAVGTGPAVSFAFGFHLGGFVPITLLGLWSLSRAHLHLADLNMRDENAGD